ncbi:MAG: hypothetical protein KAS23_09670, partial [Anaerohalosphaera sp.]|nr:hypothetical protein [Anaerohalosphaera sp.]
MKIGRIIHQQIIQLRWHFLACLGLIMVLPIEEALVNLKEGNGFYVAEMELIVASLFLSPLLAGLIACSNVQADLDDKRYIFWCSKPVSINLFMTIKYFVGLLISMVLLACPVLFAVISNQICETNKSLNTDLPVFLSVIFITIMTYSLCFFCNVLVRKTARAWLIGMAITCFLMLVPFILPLDHKDITNVVPGTSLIYLFIMLGTSIIAFALSLIATSRNWHIQTNLKGLLWTAAALIFLLMMLFTRQIANIKVLDEKIIRGPFVNCIKHAGDKLLLEFQVQTHPDPNPNEHKFENFFIEASNDHIKYETISDPTQRHRLYFSVDYSVYKQDGYYTISYPKENKSFINIDNNYYSFEIHVYRRTDDPNKKNRHRKYFHEKAFIRTFKTMGKTSELISEIDITDLIGNVNYYPSVAIRRIDNRFLVRFNKNCLLAEISQTGRIKLIEKITDCLPHIKYNRTYRDKQFSIPMVPLESISIDDKIRFSIDTRYKWNLPVGDITHNSLVDKQEGKYIFAKITEKAIERYKVVSWNENEIIAEFVDDRPFITFESIFGNPDEYEEQYFIKDGKLYTNDLRSLMVFDIRSKRIRK